MKKSCLISIILALSLLVGAVTLPANAVGDSFSCHGLQANVALDNAGKKLDTAKSVLLYELGTDTLVYSYNADNLVNPTGLVKILTVLIALEKGNLDDIVTVKQATLNTVAIGAVSAKLKAGEELTLRDLLHCIMVYSANDACAVVAAHIAGNQADFVEMMNAKARQLGCTSSNFTNAHGLSDPQQRSTPRDLAIIAKACLENDVFCQMFGMTTCTIRATNKSDERNYKTTNNMMREKNANFDSRITGGKPAAATTTDRSMICTAQIGDARYLCVVMNTKGEVSEDGLSIVRYGIFEEMKALLNYAEKTFEVRQILDDSQAMYHYAVSGGENGVTLRPSRDVFVVLPKDCDSDQLAFSHSVDMAGLTAPVALSQKLGQLTISYGTLILGSCDLLAMHAVAPSGSQITPDDRVDVQSQQENNLWTQILQTAVLVAVAVMIVAGVVTLIVRLVRNRKVRDQQRRRARNRKRSR